MAAILNSFIRQSRQSLLGDTPVAQPRLDSQPPVQLANALRRVAAAKQFRQVAHAPAETGDDIRIPAANAAATTTLFTLLPSG